MLLRLDGESVVTFCLAVSPSQATASMGDSAPVTEQVPPSRKVSPSSAAASTKSSAPTRPPAVSRRHQLQWLSRAARLSTSRTRPAATSRCHRRLGQRPGMGARRSRSLARPTATSRRHRRHGRGAAGPPGDAVGSAAPSLLAAASHGLAWGWSGWAISRSGHVLFRLPISGTTIMGLPTGCRRPTAGCKLATAILTREPLEIESSGLLKFKEGQEIELEIFPNEWTCADVSLLPNLG